MPELTGHYNSVVLNLLLGSAMVPALPIRTLSRLDELAVPSK